MMATRFGREVLGESGGTDGLDQAMAERYGPGIGAEIMGSGKFGPPGWQDDPEWRGWWGDNPPFHTPTYVLTHRSRPSLEMEGGTTFHFLDAAPADALEVARDAAAGQDVRIGGGPTMMRAFIAAGLVDHLHVVQVPILLGRGVRLWGLLHVRLTVVVTDHAAWSSVSARQGGGGVKASSNSTGVSRPRARCRRRRL